MVSKVVVFKGFWTVEDVQKNPHALFIFGDNNIGRGKGGQAIIRGLPNAIGIPTKKYPSNDPESFYTDAEYNENITKINTAINIIVGLSTSYKYIVLPEDGLGTGLADLPRKAPNTYKYLVNAINNLRKII